MSAPDDTWWCEAYGPPAADVPLPAEKWPQCFVSPESRTCSAPSVCADTMAGQRRRVYQRMQEGAAAGDEVMEDLAEHFPTPGRLLGGPDTEQGQAR